MTRRTSKLVIFVFLALTLIPLSSATLASVPTPDSNATPIVANPVFPGMSGVSPQSVPSAAEGTIAVVAASKSIDPDREALTVIVHNNTSTSLWVDDISAWLLTDYGTLVPASTEYSLISHALRPSEFSVGLVFGISALIDLDALEFEVVTGAPHVGFDLAQTALEFRDFSRNTRTFSVLVVNQEDVFVDLYFVYVFCMSESGQPGEVISTYFVGEGMVPGESIAFETTDTGLNLHQECPAYLLGTIADDWTRKPTDVFP